MSDANKIFRVEGKVVLYITGVENADSQLFDRARKVLDDGSEYRISFTEFEIKSPKDIPAEERDFIVEYAPGEPEVYELVQERYKWELVKSFKNGHHFFRNGMGDVCLADESIQNMRDPASTDDGTILLLDTSRPLLVGEDVNSIPLVVQKDRSRSSTACSRAEIKFCRDNFDMRVAVEGL